MNNTLSGRIGLSALSFLLLAGMVITIAPTAQAQTFQPALEISVKSFPTSPLIPNGAPQPIIIHWIYTFRDAEITPVTAVTTSTTIKFTPLPRCGDGVSLLVTGPPSATVAFEAAGPTTTKNSYNGDATFSVVATTDAPGETPISCTFNAAADAVGTQILAATAAPVQTNVVVAYYGLVASNVPTSIDEAGPQKQISYAIELSNAGNARSNVNFAVVDAHSGEGWNPVAPNQILLESKAQGGTSFAKTVNFLVSTPYKNGWNNKETTFVLKIQPVSTQNSDSKGGEIQVNVLARVRGIYVPGPDPMLLIVGIIGLAMVVRLRKTA